MEQNCNMDRKDVLPAAMVLAAASLWGSIGIFVRALSAGNLNSLQITAVRLLTTAAAIFCYILMTDRNRFKIHLKDMGWFAANGVCSIFFFNTCYTLCIQLSSMATAAVLLYTAPMIVIILSAVFLHEKLTGKKIFSMFIAFLGCALVSGAADGSLNTAPLGILAGLGAGFGYALYSILSSILVKKYDPLTNIFYTFSIASVVSLFIADMGEAAAVYMDEPYMLALNILAGIFTCALPYILYTGALKKMVPGRAAILASVEPVAAALLGFVLFHESLSIWGCLGIVCVLAAIVLNQ